MRSNEASRGGMLSHHNGGSEVHLWSKTDARLRRHFDFFVDRYILGILESANESWSSSTREHTNHENSTTNFSK